MHTDFSNFAEAASTQAKVFYKIGILTEVRFAAKNIHNNSTHSGGDLVARPSLLRAIGEIWLMPADPEGEVADAGRFFAEDRAEGFGYRQSHQSTSASGKKEKHKSIFQIGT